MTETTSVPTIAATIRNVLTDSGYGSYANQPVIERVAQALETREQTVYGDAYSTGQPVTDEILRRLEENVVMASDLIPDQTKGQRIRALENQVAELAEQVRNLTAFARDNGYPM